MRPIITSLLDIDYYKLTMAQLAFTFFRQIPVTFGFKNRTKTVSLPKFIKEKDLRKQLEMARAINGVTEEEAEYLLNIGFSGKFVLFLTTLRLPDYKLTTTESGYEITFSGFWPEVTFWETICLDIVNELYYRTLLKNMSRAQRMAVYAEGRQRLEKKIRTLEENPEIRFLEFATRRRFNRQQQEYVLTRLIRRVPNQIIGTSNVKLAMKYGIKAVGTFAHEMYMIFSGIFREDLRDSHNKVLQYWWEFYGWPLSTALTDTYGSDFFFRDMTPEQARNWRGLRQDSGDPVEFGEKAIAFYERIGIDSRTKTIVFSDGLDVEKIVMLHNHFKGRTMALFGWGTDLSNDMGIAPLSLVVKATEANGHSLVKLSDNVAKAMGRPEDIKLFKQVFGYDTNFSEECRY